MMVAFISQCEKNALKKTRRILDAFANRIGDNTWQTVITEEGLKTVKKMLRQTASKSTAVSCHWIRSRSRSQFLWVVGNRNKFNEQGVVPVNYTEQKISQFKDRHQWKTIGVIQYAVAISGLFHDFGKSNQLFQDKIDPKKKTNLFEPYRHEWVSLRLFQAFVGDRNDEQWLNALSQVERDGFPECFEDGPDRGVAKNHPIGNLPPLAKLVAWLILTHHKLPLYPIWKDNSPPDLKCVDEWFRKNFDALWNSHNCKDQDQENLIENNWSIEALPVASMQWRSKACMVASEARAKLQAYIKQDTNWLDDYLFTSHLSRLCLILADHYYSSQEKVTDEWRNPNYKAYANTDRKTKQFKQQLDEHLIGVAHYAQEIAKALPKLNASLQQLEPNTFLTNNVSKEYKDAFGWQDQAKKVAQDVSKASIEQGFFGINMASTGKGKTLANAKIMVALSSETGRVRFNVALGLRTLTLQTGREYRSELQLTDEQLAIAVGGIAVKQLFENEQAKVNATKEKIPEFEATGSESQDAFIDPDLYVDYRGDIDEHSLSDWTKKNDKLEKLMRAPVLVSTIDYLISATEGIRGGKQIAPMLRLLTSELVIDEPDDFGLEDLPALCRLVNWAGMLGSRVLLSTATMPPALVFALFQAYKEGWWQYAKANIENWNGEICCAWFDEFGSFSEQHNQFDLFKKAHEKFIQNRIKALNANEKEQRKGEIISVVKINSETIAASMATVIQTNIIKLHQHHHQSQDDKNVSIGLVRMANINPLVAVAKELLKQDAPEDTCIYYCVYHSRYPLAIRSHLEYKLDKILNRKKPDDIWLQEDIKKHITKTSVTNHIFVVLASPASEVGRDHDYDWAIVEPSSMRSIIQLAGRVLRHRDIIPEKANILLLNKNYRSLSNKETCFEKPGFESSQFKLATHDLSELLTVEQYQHINAVQRITLPEGYQKDSNERFLNLVELEHKALAQKLFSGNKPAEVWWKNSPHWCGEVQRQQRFRNSKKDEAYYLWLISSDYSEPCWKWKNENVYPPKFGEVCGITINSVRVSGFGQGSNFWFDLSAVAIYEKLADDFNIDLSEVSRRFGEVRLIEYNTNQEEYNYAPNLGLYKTIGNKHERRN